MHLYSLLPLHKYNGCGFSGSGRKAAVNISALLITAPDCQYKCTWLRIIDAIIGHRNWDLSLSTLFTWNHMKYYTNHITKWCFRLSRTLKYEESSLTVASDQGSSKETAAFINKLAEAIHIIKGSEEIFCTVSADYAASHRETQINKALIFTYMWDDLDI